MRKTRGLVAIGLLLAAGSIAASGCGETGGTPAAAKQAAATKTGDSAAAGGVGAASNTTATSSQAHAETSSSASSTASGASSTSTGPHHAKAPLPLPGPDSQPAPKLTPAQRANVSVADITLSSPAITQIRNASTPTLGRQYTCRGADQSPPLRWTGVPSGTKELALFVMSTTPVDGKLFFDWAVAGLNPSLKGLNGGTLPAGAVAGRNGNSQTAYSICPTGAKHESYAFVLYALPQSLSPQSGFDPASLRQQAMRLARHTGLLVGTY